MSDVRTAYTYDDITLVPQYSEVRSRFDPDTSTTFCDLERDTPIISANMDTVTGAGMCSTLWKMGALGALHRFNTVAENVTEFLHVTELGAYALVTVGVNDWSDRATRLYEAGARHFIIDVAHGHCVMMKEAVTGMRKVFGQEIKIIAGNVATPRAVNDMQSWGVDVVKLGIGSGAICKTRMVTGHGVPMFSCLLECTREADDLGVQTIADGGIRSSGDIVKALVAGADFVMLGSLLAGTEEAPGHAFLEKTGLKKTYRGMASFEAQLDRNDKVPSIAAEGVSSVISYKGNVVNVINELKMGLKSGMSYCNASTLVELPVKAEWIVQTHAGYIEGTPHIFSNR